MSAQRTERLLTLVQILLGSHAGLTKSEIFDAVELYDEADTQGAKEKLFNRDKATLRELGIPISTASEDTFFDQETVTLRYRIDPIRYRLPELSFTAPQVRLLQLAASVWDELALGESARSALRKLGIAQEGSERVGTGFGEESVALDTLTTALRDRQSVRFDYQNAAGEMQERTVNPWGLGTRYAQWYLIGFDQDRNAERVFRLSRIRGAIRHATGRAGKSRYEVPDSFDIQQTLEAMTEAVPEQDAVLHLVPGKGQVLRVAAREAEVETVAEAEAVAKAEALAEANGNPDQIHIPYRSEEHVTTLILSSAHAILGITPANIEERVRAQLNAIAALHDAPVPPRAETAHTRKPQPAREHAEQRIARLLELVPFLDINPGVSLADLALEFAVSEEQIRQDLDLLFVAGPRFYPTDLIDLSIDEDGRVFVEDPQKFDRPMTFTLDEASALLTGLEALREIVPDTAELEATQATISAALPSGTRDEAEEIPDTKATLEANISAELVALGLTETYRVLQDAIAASAQVSIEYLNATRDERTRRLVDPWELTQNNGQWYLTGWCHLVSDERTFRLDRIATANRADTQRVHAPPTTMRTPEPASVRCTLRVLPGSSYREPAGATHFTDGSFETTIDLFDLEWLPQLLTAHPGFIQILAPADAKNTVTHWLSTLPLLANSGPTLGRISVNTGPARHSSDELG